MKILIVDDEAPIKDYIAHCIKNSETPCEIIASVSSGTAALRALEQQTADLVLTDITMPRMDGLELLEQIRVRWPRTDVVMLTCHDDFSFARGAMQSGAVDYVLKSEIEPASMRVLLERVADRRKREHPEQIVARRLSFGQYLRQAMDDSTVDLLDRDAVRTYLLEYQLGDYFACLFRYNKVLLDELAKARFPWVQRQWTLPLDDSIFVLVDLIRGMSGSEQQMRIAEFSGMLRACCEEQFGISAVYHDETSLKRAALDAQAGLSRDFYRGASSQPESATDHEEALKQMFVYRNNAITALVGRDWAGFRTQMDGLFAFARDRQVNAERLKRVLCFIAEIAADGELPTTVLLVKIVGAAHLEELERLFHEFSSTLQQSDRRYSESIETALSYIMQHFRSNITLQDAAGAAFLNTEYFSRRFKKEVGVNFSEYLMTLRMQEAQRLIRTTPQRISEIAEHVGIPNVSYFTSVYKKQFGETPVETRKK